MKNIKCYKVLKDKLIDGINQKFYIANKDNLKKDTELVMLLMDIITCPYIAEDIKRNLLQKYYEIDNFTDQTDVMIFNKYWFIKWENFNLVEEIEMKKGQEVYG